MKTNEQIIAQIEQEYQDKKIKNEINQLEKRKKLYYNHPKIEKIDNEISSNYLKIMKMSIQGLTIDDTLYKNINQLNKEKQIYIKSNSLKQSDFDISYDCPDCKDTGYIQHTHSAPSKCQCYINRYNSLAYENTNMLKLIKECNFDNFNIDIFDDTNIIGKFTQREFMSKMRNKALHFVDNFLDTKEKSMLFYGPVGVGKSYLCLCIADALIKRRKNVLYESSIELFEKLAKYVFSSDKSETEYSTFNHLVYSCDLLIIDDLGIEINNEFVKNQLFNIINMRIIQSKKTIISSNLTQDNLQERYEQRIFSRISDNYGVYKFIGRDLRMPKLKY